MVDELLELPSDTTLNIDGKRNVPLCPMCTEELTNAERTYKYRRMNPDTRWFFCSDCNCHLGYHRMKKKWKVDPYELDKNDKVRAYFGLDPAEE